MSDRSELSERERDCPHPDTYLRSVLNHQPYQ
jgi:hypothetical protein